MNIHKSSFVTSQTFVPCLRTYTFTFYNLSYNIHIRCRNTISHDWVRYTTSFVISINWKDHALSHLIHLIHIFMMMVPNQVIICLMVNIKWSSGDISVNGFTFCQFFFDPKNVHNYRGPWNKLISKRCVEKAVDEEIDTAIDLKEQMRDWSRNYGPIL